MMLGIHHKGGTPARAGMVGCGKGDTPGRCLAVAVALLLLYTPCQFQTHSRWQGYHSFSPVLAHALPSPSQHSFRPSSDHSSSSQPSRLLHRHADASNEDAGVNGLGRPTVIPYSLFTGEGSTNPAGALPAGNQSSANAHVNGASWRRSLLGWAQSSALRLMRRRRRPVEGCWSKTEQRTYFRADRSAAPSEAFVKRYKEYKRMHRRCTADISNWEEYFHDATKGIKSGADVVGCKYLLFQSPQYHGVGNRLMGLVSAFALALLTDRAILIEEREFLGQALCSPFARSTWRQDSKSFNYIIDRVKNFVNDPKLNTTVFDLHISWNWTPWYDLCEDRQKEEGTNRFGIMYTDFYVVPVYYLTKRFKDDLEKWFPDRRVFMQLGRVMLLPANHLWDRITRIYNGYLSHHNFKIGLQIRETHDTGIGLMVNVMDCLVNKSKLLTDALTAKEWRESAAHTDDETLRAFPRRSTGIFVTSLNGQHASVLHDRYTRGKPLDGSSVNVYTLSHYQKELAENYAHYEAAAVEMWLLSFSDALLITDYSTFGYVASGLSGIEPYMLNVAIRGPDPSYDWRKNKRPTCVAAFSEPCLVADVYRKCRDEKKEIAAWDDPLLTICPGVNRFLMVRKP